MKILKSHAGMSLVEVMVTASILGGLAVATTLYTKNAEKSTTNNKKKNDIEEIMGRIVDKLENKDNCNATVMGAAAGVNVLTPITSIKSIVGTGANIGAIESDTQLAVSAVTAGDNRNQAIINGMYLVNRLDTTEGGNYELVVTFVKNPAAAGGNARSASNTMGNYPPPEKIQLKLDNCSRNYRWAVAPNTPTCLVGTQATAPVTVFSSNGTSPDTAFNVIACRDCATRTTVRGCN